ncbi:unnamed protein product, partial [Didymodactylos carnosus]
MSDGTRKIKTAKNGGEDEIKLHELFKLVDKNQDYEIGVEELIQALGRIGVKTQEKRMEIAR